jgi:ABC-type uncharacterized transport system substrate-binding protein
MLAAVEVIAKLGRDARIPVFTCIPGNATKGALFDLGANYYEVGRTLGRVASRVLQGESIAKIPVEIAIPPKLFVNTTVLKDISGDWSFPADVLHRADSLIDETGQHDQPSAGAAKASAPPAMAPGKRWNVRLLSYVNSPDSEEAEQGFLAGLKKSGLEQGRDYGIRRTNAQGDMGVLNGMVDAALGENTDLLLTISTPTLQSCAQRVKGIPIVFTMVTNPFLAGAGTSETDHLQNVTGAYGSIDVQNILPIIKQLMPHAKRVGALYAPAEINSVYYHELLSKAVKESGYELLSLGINSAAETLEATQSLCDRRVDLFCLPNSGLASSSYPAIAHAAARAKIPVFGFMGSIASQGAVVVLSIEYYDMGIESGQIAARVIRGEQTDSIPLHRCTKSKLLVNPAAAAACGINLPETLLKLADVIIGQ